MISNGNAFIFAFVLVLGAAVLGFLGSEMAFVPFIGSMLAIFIGFVLEQMPKSAFPRWFAKHLP